MALRSSSSTRQQQVGPRDSPPAEGGSGNGARAKFVRKTKEVKELFADLKEEGVQIDDKITCIIHDEIARIKAEVDRENNINVRKRNRLIVLTTISSAALGFLLGVDRVQQSLYGQLARIVFGE